MGSGVTCYDAPRNSPQRCHTLVCDVNNIAKQRHITSLWWSPGMPRVVSKSMRIIADIAIADNPLAHHTHAGQRFPVCRHESHPSRWTGCSTIGVSRNQPRLKPALGLCGVGVRAFDALRWLRSLALVEHVCVCTRSSCTPLSIAFASAIRPAPAAVRVASFFPMAWLTLSSPSILPRLSATVTAVVRKTRRAALVGVQAL